MGFRVTVLVLGLATAPAYPDHDPFAPTPRERERSGGSENGKCDPTGPQYSPSRHSTNEFQYRTPRVLSTLRLRPTSAQAKAEAVENRQRRIGTMPADQAGLRTETPVLKGAKILSLGEGYSGLVPFFRSQGADARGLDLVYKKEPEDDFQKQYRERHQGHLIPGDATKIDVADRSQDLVVSHAMGGLRDRFMNDAMREAFRVTKVGGQIRFSVAADRDPATTMEQVRALMKGIPPSQFTAEVDLGTVSSSIRTQNLDEYPWDSLPKEDIKSILAKAYRNAGGRSGSPGPNFFCSWDNQVNETPIATIVVRRKAD